MAEVFGHNQLILTSSTKWAAHKKVTVETISEVIKLRMNSISFVGFAWDTGR